jgi:putative ABC transport system permease protein
MTMLPKFAFQVRPILAALTRHKLATLLIVVQIALTLAAASNALFIAGTRLIHLSRPTGTDEAHLFVVTGAWRSGLSATQIDADIQRDLLALRGQDGIDDAFAGEAFPLGGGYGRLLGLMHTADQKTKPQLAVAYFADEHAIHTLGVRLLAGRNFRSDEIRAITPDDPLKPAVIIITQSLAHKLFPAGDALGRSVFLAAGPAQIIGIVEILQGPYAGSTTRSIDEDNLLIPARYSDPDRIVYLVRTRASAAQPIIDASIRALAAQGSALLLDPATSAVSLANARTRSYATDRSVALLMTAISSLLLLATAAGIIGLSSFWVSQRRKQIGIRRALGASHRDILQHFHLENFLIVSLGIALGAVLAVLANITLMKLYELPLMPATVISVGACLLWLLGQVAVLGPARNASRIPPVAAIRSA